MVLQMVMEMVARPLLQRAGSLDEHTAGEVSREAYGLVVAGSLTPAASVEMGTRVDALLGHHLGAVQQVVAEVVAGGLGQAWLLSQGSEVAEEDAVEQATVALYGIARHTKVVRLLMDDIVGRPDGIVQVTLVAGELIQLVGSPDKGAAVVGKGGAADVAFAVHIVVHGPGLMVKEVGTQPGVDGLGLG